MIGQKHHIQPAFFDSHVDVAFVHLVQDQFHIWKSRAPSLEQRLCGLTNARHADAEPDLTDLWPRMRNTATVSDPATWDWGGPRSDLVAAIFIQFAEPALRDHIFQKMKDALVPGGLLLLEGYRPEQLAYGTGGPQEMDKLYTPALLKQAFADMDILLQEEYDAELNEGERHKGMSAVIDLVAQKV